MKKFNAYLALLTLILFGAHAVLMSSLMLGLVPFKMWYKMLTEIFVCIFFLHALVSIGIFFFGGDSTSLARYKRLNIGTILQRASAILLIVVLHIHVHVYGAGDMVYSLFSAVFFMITELVFLSGACVHIATSVSKACITLGLISEEESLQRVNKISLIVVIIIGLYCAFAMARYLLGGVL